MKTERGSNCSLEAVYEEREREALCVDERQSMKREAQTVAWRQSMKREKLKL